MRRSYTNSNLIENPHLDHSTTVIYEFTSNSGEKIPILGNNASIWGLPPFKEDDLGAKTRDQEPHFRTLNRNLERHLNAILPNSCIHSPEAFYSFSPRDLREKQRATHLNHTIRELIHSEELFCNSLGTLERYFIEPLYLRCIATGLECSPLLNLKSNISNLLARHMRFYKAILKNSSPKNCAQKILTLFEVEALCQHEVHARLTLKLIELQVPPFESKYIQQMQNFLESNQPRDRNIDLSILLLLQIPLSRIGKYKIFLSNFQKLCAEEPQYQLINKKLGEILIVIDDTINKHRTYEIDFEVLNCATNFNKTGLYIEFYGLAKQSIDCNSMILSVEGKIIWKCGACRVILFQLHFLVYDLFKKQTMVIIPYRSCKAGISLDEDFCTEKRAFVVTYRHFEAKIDISFNMTSQKLQQKFMKMIQKENEIMFSDSVFSNRDGFMCTRIKLALKIEHTDLNSAELPRTQANDFRKNGKSGSKECKRAFWHFFKS